MKIIACLNHNMDTFVTPQTLPSHLLDDIMSEIGTRPLWIAPNSAFLFNGCQERLIISQFFIEKAALNDFCFVSSISLSNYEDWITQIILYCFSSTECLRGFRFDLLLESQWELKNLRTFTTFSHEKITKMAYERK